ncbi:HVA22-like protein a [Hibiscus syriacus]|uniref:HVA22-like protein a n=1 Tax=Hibiscus syriacus TaxID=106335 RepID=UPI001920C4F9|nr:HVA22-like protein a [Hibiscus syriacus]
MGLQDLVKFALICFDSLAWPVFALGYPLLASIQAIETNSNTDAKKLVTYWIIFSLISLFEHAFMGILQWLPFWPYIKLMIVCWMMIPRFDGAFYVYNHFVQPCLYMDLPTIINWFKRLQQLLLNNFLADEYAKAHRPPEALDKLIVNEPKGTEASILQKDIKPVRLSEKTEVAPVNQNPAPEPDVVQTVNNKITLPEINGEAGFNLTEIPLEKQVQKEWTCAMCQVKVSSEITLNSHLQGRNT